MLFTLLDYNFTKRPHTGSEFIREIRACVRPHKAVSRETISRWISSVMLDAGLDVNIFSPHSLRAATSSKVRKAKVPINTILETAGWTRESTFRQFYDKPIKEQGQFGVALLENSL